MRRLILGDDFRIRNPFQCMMGSALCVIGFVVPNMVRYLFHASALLSVMRIKYTKLSLLMLVYAAIDDMMSSASSALVPVLLVNFFGLSASFHAAYLFDRHVYARLARKNGWTMPTFWLLNFFVHILPPILLLAWFLSNPKQYTLDQHTGVYTALFNVFWSLCTAGGLNMSKLYVECSDNTWYGAWIVGITTHMCTGYVIYSIP